MHEDDLAAAFLYHMLMLEQGIEIIQRHCQFLSPESFHGVFDQFHTVLPGEIQDGALRACI